MTELGELGVDFSTEAHGAVSVVANFARGKARLPHLGCNIGAFGECQDAIMLSVAASMSFQGGARKASWR